MEDRSIKKRHVYRQVWRARDKLRAFVLKKFEPERSGIERQAIERWLPILGMADVAPALLAVVATSDARSVWHVYEDLGDRTLDADDKPQDGSSSPRDRGFLTAMTAPPDWQRLKAVLSSLAHLHEASAGHPILGECRHWTRDLGGHFLRSNVRDAIAALEALSPGRVSLSPSQTSTRDTLVETLWRLNEEVADRCAESGGPWRTRSACSTVILGSETRWSCPPGANGPRDSSTGTMRAWARQATISLHFFFSCRRICAPRRWRLTAVSGAAPQTAGLQPKRGTLFSTPPNAPGLRTWLSGQLYGRWTVSSTVRSTICPPSRPGSNSCNPSWRLHCNRRHREALMDQGDVTRLMSESSPRG